MDRSTRSQIALEAYEKRLEQEQARIVESDNSALRKFLAAHSAPCPNFHAVASLGWKDARVAEAAKRIGAKRGKWGFWELMK